MESLVSILIPTYNRELYIREAIESAINQKYKNLEIIIVDNCSKDNTTEIINDYLKLDNRIKYYINKENIGPVLNWHKCIELASGEYVKILWSDDLIDDNFIIDTISIFSNNTAFVLTGYNISDSESKKILYNSKFQYKNYSTIEYIRDLLLFNTCDFPVSPASAIFRLKDLRNSFVIEIPNNENLDSKINGAGNDLLMMLNIAINKKYDTIKCINKKSTIFRAHKNSFSIANNLNIYYEYARLFFVASNIELNITNSYLSRLLFLSKRNKSYDVIYKHAKNKFAKKTNIVKYIVQKIYYKFRLKLFLFLNNYSK
jgi:glycosyltransferase involved in cell wall biosynthesis